jgi:hypothetical protein
MLYRFINLVTAIIGAFNEAQELRATMRRQFRTIGE